MIQYLKLTNFKRHESLELNFSGGLQLIRAASEAGKSSMLQAIAYALYGARALPMSLAATVTYDKPESSLRVLLRFSFNGSEFEVERHKGGAELRGDGVTASGQAEVTAFVERLFGCNAATATSLMFANQGALRGALEGGPGAAVSLIEKLADVDALDRLVEKAQENLPSGNTKLLEARIAELADVKRPVADFSTLEATLADSESIAEAAALRMAELQASLAEVDVAALGAAVTAAKVAEQALATSHATMSRLKPIAEATKPTLIDLKPLKQAVEDGKGADALRRQYQEFLGTDQYEHMAASFEEVSESIDKINKRLAEIKPRIRELTREQAQAEMAIIKGNLCDFCGKSFDDVPEVLAKNEKCQVIAAATASSIKALEDEEAQLLDSLGEWNQVVDAGNILDRVMSRLPVEAFGGYPRKYKWVGGNIPEASSLADAQKALTSAEKSNVTAQKLDAEIEMAKRTLQDLDMPALETKALKARHMADAAEVVLAKVQTWNSLLTDETAIERKAIAAVASNRSLLAVARSDFSIAMKSYRDSIDALDKAKADLSTYVLNNRVIKKIRDARPLVAKQLWGTVLGTVSHYFSQVRGTPSLVTREGSGFLVDGKPVEGLSGSTLDALGLAIRIALTRTFLSNVPWLILDEPAAACDDSREAAMMGVVSGCGFPQVLMVSHSELGEAYASNVVTL